MFQRPDACLTRATASTRTWRQRVILEEAGTNEVAAIDENVNNIVKFNKALSSHVTILPI